MSVVCTIIQQHRGSLVLRVTLNPATLQTAKDGHKALNEAKDKNYKHCVIDHERIRKLQMMQQPLDQITL